MESLPLFKAPGNWYKGNLHTHTTVSDGARSIEDTVNAYREKGYGFLAVTDHRRVTPSVEDLSDDAMTVISGSELHPPNPFGGHMYHFVALDVREEKDWNKVHPQQMIDALQAGGALVYLAHPYWTGHDYHDILPLQGYDGVEVFNSTCDRIGRSTSESEWDLINRYVGPIPAIAVDDTHAEDDAFGGWITLKATDNSKESVFRALDEGMFYSSCGPEIHDVAFEMAVERDGGGGEKVTVKAGVRCSPARKIWLKSLPVHGRRMVAAGKPLEEAEMSFSLEKPGDWVRVVVEDAEGRRAWSNPFVPYGVGEE